MAFGQNLDRNSPTPRIINETMIEYTCPCCGYPKLTAPPYANANNNGLVRGLTAPYSIHLGIPSYEVCPCCGFEFGNDDEPGTAAPTTFEQYLDEWVADGQNWLDQSKRPSNWSLDEQLSKTARSKPNLTD